MSSENSPFSFQPTVTATPTLALGERLAQLETLHESREKSRRTQEYEDPAWDHPHPIHTVYGGAHLFKAQTVTKLGKLAAQSFLDHCPDVDTFGHIFDLKSKFSDETLTRVYERIKQKIDSSPIEDYRIDFEDGLGIRSDGDEDRIALESARSLLQASEDGQLAPLMGIRIKSFATAETSRRAIRTLEIFMATALSRDPSRFPKTFIVTLPKVAHSTEVATFVQLLRDLKERYKLEERQLLGEIMIESHDAILDRDGTIPLFSLVSDLQDRFGTAAREPSATMLLGVHFGAHDYLASLDCGGVHPNLRHPACDLARNLLKLAFSNTPLAVVDGAETYLPIGGPDVVQHAWRLSFSNVWHALDQGIYQGWDLHPAQIPARLAAVYTYFIAGLPSATARLKNFVNGLTQAARVGANFDDLATAQGLLNFFNRALRCGAITPDEARQTGLGLADFNRRVKSFEAFSLESR